MDEATIIAEATRGDLVADRDEAFAMATLNRLQRMERRELLFDLVLWPAFLILLAIHLVKISGAVARILSPAFVSVSELAGPTHVPLAIVAAAASVFLTALAVTRA